MADLEAPRGSERVEGEALAGRRETFLSHFAANCNVTAAANAAGVPVSTLYRWRRDDADFAEEWGQALAMGYQLLEARLVAHALAGEQHGDVTGIAELNAAPVPVELALRLMGLQRHSKTRGFAGRPLKTMPREDMLKVLLARIEMIEQRKRIAAERAAAKTIEHRPGAGA